MARVPTPWPTSWKTSNSRSESFCTGGPDCPGVRPEKISMVRDDMLSLT
jgi:hypothetical protein